MSGVTLKQVIKKFGETQVIHGVDLDIKDGELCVFVGPSGCGKSTLLRMIAGLEQTSAGTITIGDRDVTTADPADRGVAMVFQSYALYPHMTVAENMGFGLKMNGVPKKCRAGKGVGSRQNPEARGLFGPTSQGVVGRTAATRCHWTCHCPWTRGVFV